MREQVKVGSAAGDGPGRSSMRWSIRTSGRSGRRRRRESGPRPVRPAVVPGGGPAAPARRVLADVSRASARLRPGETTAAGAVVRSRAERVRAGLATVLAVVLAAVIVVGLGLLADVAAAGRAAAPGGPSLTHGDVLLHR